MTAPAGLEHQWHVPRHRDGSRTGKLEISFSCHSEAEKVTWTLCQVYRLMNISLYHVEADDIDLKKKQM